MQKTSKTKLDTKTALLNSAEKAVRSRGFDAFSYADMAEDIGIKTASIHYHFRTKADLSSVLMQRYHEAFEEICASIVAEHETGGGRLAALIDRYRLAHNGATQVCLCVAFSISRDSLSETVITQINRFRRMIRDWIADAFALGKADGSIDAVKYVNQEAAAALALLEGAQLSARSTLAPAVFEEAVSLLQSRIHLAK